MCKEPGVPQTVSSRNIVLDFISGDEPTSEPPAHLQSKPKDGRLPCARLAIGSCDIKFPIRLEGLAYSYGQFSSYEAEVCIIGLLARTLLIMNAALPQPHLLHAVEAEGRFADLCFQEDSVDWCKGNTQFFATRSFADTLYRSEKRSTLHSIPSTRCCASSGNLDIANTTC